MTAITSSWACPVMSIALRIKAISPGVFTFLISSSRGARSLNEVEGRLP